MYVYISVAVRMSICVRDVRRCECGVVVGLCCLSGLHTKLHTGGHLIDLAASQLDFKWLPGTGCLRCQWIKAYMPVCTCGYQYTCIDVHVQYMKAEI